MNIILIILLLLLYIKWIFIFAIYPSMYFYGQRSSNKSLICKILSAPYSRINFWVGGGVSRFVLYHISFIPSNRIRKLFYKGLGVKVGSNAVIHFRTEIRCPERLSIGDGSIIGDNVILDARQHLTLGKNVNISSNVSIYTLQHDHRDPFFACNEDKKKMSVEIDDRVWLGCNVIVLPGVHIGEGAVCCAGCVVTKDVEPYAVVAGIPAKKVSERPQVLEYNFNGETCSFY